MQTSPLLTEAAVVSKLFHEPLPTETVLKRLMDSTGSIELMPEKVVFAVKTIFLSYYS